MLSLKKTGDWKRAGVVLKGLSVNLCPSFKAQMDEDGKLILDTLVGHIAKQDLPWVPLSPTTVRIKRGKDTVYVDTGYLKNNLSVRRIKSAKDSYTIFIGASPWKRHKPSGRKFSDILIWLEYGTSKIPPRPLIRPTWRELEPIIRSHWSEVVKSLVRTGESKVVRSGK